MSAREAWGGMKIRRHRFDPLFFAHFAVGIFRMWRGK